MANHPASSTRAPTSGSRSLARILPCSACCRSSLRERAARDQPMHRQPAPLSQLFEDDSSYRTGSSASIALGRRAERAANSGGRGARSRLAALYMSGARSSWRSRGAELAQLDELFSYVEDCALRREQVLTEIDNIPGHDPRGSALPAVRGVQRPWLPRYDNRHLDAQYYYAIGFHLAILARRIDPSWRTCVHTQRGRLLGVALRVAAANARACD